MSQIELKNEAVIRARDRLEEAMHAALEHLLVKWAVSNHVTLSERAVETGIEKLLEGAR